MRFRPESAVCLAAALLGCGGSSPPLSAPVSPQKVVVNSVAFHGDSQRRGWNSLETQLTPSTVASAKFGPLWNSPQFDSLNIGNTTYPPHLYATPLYVDDVLVTAGTFSGSHLSVIYAATSNGWVYAVNVLGTTLVSAGTILWSTKLGQAAPAQMDGGVPLGVLSTPIVDLTTSPPRIYAASDVSDVDGRNWKVFALDLGSGAVLPGWPVTINDSIVSVVNKNGPATFQAAAAMSQRGALNLSPDARLLYVPFGSYGDTAAGFMVTIDTRNAKVASGFSGAPSTLTVAQGGMWGSGGPAIDIAGRVYETTGNSPDGAADAFGVWGDSLLEWDATSDLSLMGSYSPWNYCQMDTADTDLGGSSPMILPDLDPSTTSTPHLIAFGSKQGVVYLLNRDKLPGRLDHRPACNFTDSAHDASLLPLDPQPPFETAGPLSVFGPYSETCTQVDMARMRTTPAYFLGMDGTNFIFVSGAQKQSECDKTPVPPGLVRLRIVTLANNPASLKIDAQDSVLSLLSPGPPVLSSNGSKDLVVWVLDANLFRSATLVGANVAHPVLYAMDGNTMQLLWHSTSDQLNVGGKYNHVVVAHGMVFVGTDRIQAFGLHQ